MLQFTDQNGEVPRKSGKIKIIEMKVEEMQNIGSEKQYQNQRQHLNQNDFGQVFQTNESNTRHIFFQSQSFLSQQQENTLQQEQIQIQNPQINFPDSQPWQVNNNTEQSAVQNSIQNQLAQKPSMDINIISLFDRFYKDQLVEYVLPIKPDNKEMIIQQQRETLYTNSDYFNGSTQESSNISNSINNTQPNSLEVSELEYQLDDVVPDYFKLLLDNFLENQTQNDFGKQFPSNSKKKINRYIKIVEVQNFGQLSKELLDIFPKLRYSYVCYVIPFLITKDKCIEFLQNNQHIILKQQKAILNIKEVPITPNVSQVNFNKGTKKEKSQFQADISKTQQHKKKTSFEFYSNQNKAQSELISNQSSRRFTLEEKYKAYEKNRLQIIELYKEKAQLIKNFSSAGINEQTFNSKIQKIKMKIIQIIEEGQKLFVDLMIIKDQFCQVDFHKIFAAEIEGLLDAIFDKIDIYKEQNQGKVITLKLIVGKGNHSINGVPIIGPMTKQYIKTELQKDVKIDKGVILLYY